MNISERIIYFRELRKYSTTKLAKLAGIAQSTLREIELGNTSPTWDTIEKLCSALEISPLELLVSSDSGSENGLALSLELKQLLEEVKTLTPLQRQKLTDFIKSMQE